MGHRVSPGVCALLALAAAGAEFRTKTETRGRVTAWLDIRVADKPAEPGFAEVTLIISLEGSTTLAVRQIDIKDTVSGWKEETKRPPPSIRRGDDRILWTQTLALKQTRAGQVPLPAVKVTFRDGADEASVEWTDLLRQPRGLPAPAEVPAPPTAPDRRRAGAALLLVAANVLVVALFSWVSLRRRRRQPPLTAEQRAARELDSAAALMATDVAAAHERVADVVRGFLADRFQLPVTRQTTAEFLEAVSRDSPLSEQQRDGLREFFERCDLVKFAGVRPPPDECWRTAEMAREIIALRETTGPSQAAAVPTPGR
jgi:hypothetical protein